MNIDFNTISIVKILIRKDSPIIQIGKIFIRTMNDRKKN